MPLVYGCAVVGLIIIVVGIVLGHATIATFIAVPLAVVMLGMAFREMNSQARQDGPLG